MLIVLTDLKKRNQNWMNTDKNNVNKMLTKY